MRCIQTHSLVVYPCLWVVEVFLEISIVFWLVFRVGSHLQTILLKMSLHFGRSLMWERKSNKSEIFLGRLRCRRLHLHIVLRQLLLSFFIYSQETYLAHVEQELRTLPEHLSSLQVFSGVHADRSLAFLVMFCRSLFVLWSF